MKDSKLTLENEEQVKFLLGKVLEQKEITYSNILALSKVLGEMVIEKYEIEHSDTQKKCAACKEILIQQDEKEYGFCEVCLSQRMN